MLDFLRFVAEAVVENGVKGLAQMVPGGPFIYSVAESVQRKLREQKQAAKLHEEMVHLVNMRMEDLQVEVCEVVREVVADKPSDGSSEPITAEAVADLQQLLVAIPESLRASLKSPEDPSGRTVPPNFAFRSPDDVVKLLPPRLSKFRSGDPLPGKRGWILDRLLGIGGFGEVWYTRHVQMTSLTGAVKFCLGQTGQDLIHEANLIDRVMTAGKHPNIVPLIDCHLEGDAPWLLFEYVSGGCLTDWIHQLAGNSQERRLAQTLAALKQITDAVATFHGLDRPIVHRDLKPSNILLDRTTKRLRITDFGIGGVTARETNRMESQGHTTSAGRLLSYMRGSHTPLYSSPQQRTGADPDPRDDIHALGVIAYQMLTGHLAQGAGPDFADDLRDAGASENLIALLGKCVAQKPDRRPTDARELAKLLAASSAALGKPTEAIGAETATRSFENPSASTPKQPDTPLSRGTSVPSQWADVEADSEGLLKESYKGNGTEKWLQAHANRAQRWRESAEHGVMFGMHLWGRCLESGIGVAKNPQEAMKWFYKASDMGHAAAMTLIGFNYHLGNDVKEDFAEALRWYHKAADRGSSHAMNNIGTMFGAGEGVKQDYVEAMKWYRKAADMGNGNALRNIASLYDNGNGVKQDYVEAMKWYGKAADIGNAQAMNNIGALFDLGQGVKQDHVVAMKWYRKAADLGNHDSLRNVACLFENGQGVAQNYDEALRWYRKAADAGNHAAENDIGRCYHYGLGVKQDYAEALRWYRKAAHSGDASAMCNLGYLIESGHGVKHDYSEALSWYSKAAAAGSDTAMNNIGSLYYHGQGVQQDYAQSMSWYRRAAAAGNAVAMSNIAAQYNNGFGVPRDLAEAFTWNEKAAVAGNAKGMGRTARFYYHGVCIAKDYAKSIEWSRKGAELGDAISMCQLAVHYARGEGVVKDDAAALNWLQKARQAGNARITNTIHQIEELARKNNQSFVELAAYAIQEAARDELQPIVAANKPQESAPVIGTMKATCPSCEHRISLLPSFVGKKIDCPKCKYRFVLKAN